MFFYALTLFFRPEGTNILVNETAICHLIFILVTVEASSDEAKNFLNVIATAINTIHAAMYEESPSFIEQGAG